MKWIDILRGSDSTRKGFSYTCPCCGQVYEQMPLCFNAEHPYYYYSIPQEERASRVDMTSSLCVIDGRHFFHRGRLIIPITDYDEDLTFDVWTSISHENFGIRTKMWEDPARVQNDPYFGWMQTMIPTYGDTINLKSVARESEVDSIPVIEMIEDGHPLTLDQQLGISFEQAVKKVAEILRIYHKDQG